VAKDGKATALFPFVVARTLGKSMGSVHLATVWGLLSGYPRHAAEDLVRAGHKVHPFTGETLFQMILEHPEGIVIGKVDPDKSLEKLKTPDKKIHLHIPEMAEWMTEIDPEQEEKALHNEEFPFVLSAGRHFAYNANTNMRDPAMNDHKRVYGMLISETDAQALGLGDGDDAWVTTEAARVKIPVEISDIPAGGSVIIPHGFGMIYDDKEYGVNTNLLTKNTHRDRIAATPLHRYVPCRVEAA
jgi:anaerobic selenocysteine-containing dehydrogenase